MMDEDQRAARRRVVLAWLGEPETPTEGPQPSGLLGPIVPPVPPSASPDNRFAQATSAPTSAIDDSPAPNSNALSSGAAVSPSLAWPDPPLPSYDAAEAARARQNWVRTLSRPYANRAVRPPHANGEAAAGMRPDYLESSALWPVAPLPTEPGREPMMHGIYAAPVRRAPRWDTVVTSATPWSVRSPLPSATSWREPDRGTECYVSDGNLYCTTPGGMQLTVPANGLYEGLRITTDHPDYHYYDVPATAPRGSRRNYMPRLVNDPTPGIDRAVRPATAQGTDNPAAPWYIQGLSEMFPPMRRIGSPSWPVKSYRTTDQNGTPVVVNVTQPGHPLYPGVVIRYQSPSPSGSTIQTEGTGLSWWQSPRGWIPRGVHDFANDFVWRRQSEDFMHGNRRHLQRGIGQPLE